MSHADSKYRANRGVDGKQWTLLAFVFSGSWRDLASGEIAPGTGCQQASRCDR
jgi:hypothetical protein